MFFTVESPSRNLASREHIYKTFGVAGPASALSSLSHKLKGGYACICERALPGKLPLSSVIFIPFHSLNYGLSFYLESYVFEVIYDVPIHIIL